MNNIDELWKSIKELEKETDELKECNDNKVNEIFDSVIAWCAEKIADCKCPLPNVIDLGLKVTGYGYDKELQLYCGNCHSFDDWRGACFTAGRYGEDRNNDYLAVFVIKNWQEIKSRIIDSLAKEQAKVIKRHISDYEKKSKFLQNVKWVVDMCADEKLETAIKERNC